MSTHNIFLVNRVQTSLATTYPAALLAGESLFYGAGSSTKYPLQVRVAKAPAAGQNITVKVQAAALPVDGAAFAVRGPGGEQGLFSVFGVTGDLYTVQLTQRSGNSLGYLATITGTVGLDAKLTLGLPTDPLGRGIGTPAGAAAYINATLTDFIATASGAGSSAGQLGATLDARSAPRIHWNDVETNVQGTVAVEHVFNATAGSFVEATIEVTLRNYLALRALAKSAGAPGSGDSVQVLVAAEGQ